MSKITCSCSDFELTRPGPYVTLRHELWGVHGEYLHKTQPISCPHRWAMRCLQWAYVYKNWACWHQKDCIVLPHSLYINQTFRELSELRGVFYELQNVVYVLPLQFLHYAVHTQQLAVRHFTQIYWQWTPHSSPEMVRYEAFFFSLMRDLCSGFVIAKLFAIWYILYILIYRDLLYIENQQEAMSPRPVCIIMISHTSLYSLYDDNIACQNSTWLACDQNKTTQSKIR